MTNLSDIITPSNVVTETSTDTLTNKTLTSPAITNMTLGGTAVTSTAAELNVLDGIPAGLTATELGYVDGVTSSIQAQFDALGGAATYKTASGALANGDTVIINANGTV